MSNFIEVECQFCGETDFDLLGVKLHLLNGHCPVFESLESPAQVERKMWQSKMDSLARTQAMTQPTDPPSAL